MNHEWLFLPMRSSNDLLSDPAGLKARLEEDSYLYFSRVQSLKWGGLRSALFFGGPTPQSCGRQ